MTDRLPADLIIFDLDGTLIDSSKDIAWATNKTLATLGMKELPYEEILGYIGWGVKMLLLQALPEENHHLFDDARDVFMSCYADHLLVDTRPYPGVEETLGSLRDRKKTLAIVTNKPVKLAEAILEDLSLKDYFDPVLGGDSVHNKKPHPEGIEKVINGLSINRDCTVFVGDSRIDVVAGKSAGIRTVGAAYGFRGRDELEEAGADIIIEQIGDLQESTV